MFNFIHLYSFFGQKCIHSINFFLGKITIFFSSVDWNLMENLFWGENMCVGGRVSRIYEKNADERLAE